jgi:hypothetical protein
MTLKVRGGKRFAALDLADRTFLGWILPIIADKIVRRVRQQKVDVHGAALPPYTKGYAIRKRRHSRWSGGTDYTWDGDLFDVNMALTFQARRGRRRANNADPGMTIGRIYFAGRHRSARAQVIADKLLGRRGMGVWTRGQTGGPGAFMGITAAESAWVEEEWRRRVLEPAVKNLPPAIRLEDIAPAFRRYIEIGGSSPGAALGGMLRETLSMAEGTEEGAAWATASADEFTWAS